MALWDPEAAGNAAVYLRLDNLKLIDIRNAPFEGRTACWIPYAETGYTKGKKTGKEETDEKTKVKKIEVERLVDGKMKMFKEEDVEPQNPPKYELLEDMANMTYLSEASVVHNLKSRYEIFLIYTVSFISDVGKPLSIPNATWIYLFPAILVSGHFGNFSIWPFRATCGHFNFREHFN